MEAYAVEIKLVRSFGAEAALAIAILQQIVRADSVTNYEPRPLGKGWVELSDSLKQGYFSFWNESKREIVLTDLLQKGVLNYAYINRKKYYSFAEGY